MNQGKYVVGNNWEVVQGIGASSACSHTVA